MVRKIFTYHKNCFQNKYENDISFRKSEVLPIGNHPAFWKTQPHGICLLVVPRMPTKDNK